MVTAMGGLGMTLSWALARTTVEDWTSAGQPREDSFNDGM
jgi:hypothetical protein